MGFGVETLKDAVLKLGKEALFTEYSARLNNGKQTTEEQAFTIADETGKYTVEMLKLQKDMRIGT